MNRRELLERQIRNLFVVDAQGRLARVNEPRGGPPPFAYLARCGDGCVGFVRADLDGGLAASALALIEDEPAADDFSEPPFALHKLAQLAAEAGLAVASRRAPGYVALHEANALPIDVEIVNASGMPLHPWIAARWGTHVLPQMELALGVMVKGQLVSLCHSARLGPNDAEAGVETAEEFRNRGYAAAATAAWITAVRASGRMAFYSTDWENVASQGVARRAGLTLLGELNSVG